MYQSYLCNINYYIYKFHMQNLIVMSKTVLYIELNIELTR